MIIKKDICVWVTVLLALTACNHSGQQPDKPVPIQIPDMSLDVHFKRMEKELYPVKQPFDSNSVHRIRNTYGDFFDIWLFRLAGILPPYQDHAPDAVIADNLNQYLHDKYISEVYASCSSEFSDLSAVEKDLSDVFKRYKHAFPGKFVPQFITYVSPFTSNVTATDSALGLGLHFYLGSDYKYYPTLGLPRYMIRRFRQEYMLPDLIHGWLDSEFISDTVQLNCLNQMIYQGKLLYATEVLSPGTPDTLLTGYSTDQLKWVRNNELNVWTFLIEQKLLYATSPKEYIKFINDGNGTTGFPESAPAKLGVYIGWQIVRSFMEQNPDLNLADLMRINDGQLILTKSGYKPPKPD